MTTHARNPIHAGTCSPDVSWSTINAGEALPGVVTPLTWSLFGDNVERAMRSTFADMGVLRPDELAAPAGPDARLWDTWYGRAAGNLNTFRSLGDRTPGTSGAAVEEQIFGAVREGIVSKPDRSRYHVVAVKMPYNAFRVRARLKEEVGGITTWWQASVGPDAPTTLAGGRELLREASRRHESVMRPHTLAAMLCQGLYDQIVALTVRAGKPGLETRLVTGYGEMAETDVVSDLWQVSRDRLSLDEFVRRHGFHGPNEGELAARVWRLRREPVERLIAHYRGMDDERDPRTVEAARGDERRRAEAELLAALPPLRRAPAKLVLGLAARLIPMRGVGKAAFLRCSDVARAAARIMGAELHEQGLLDDPEDVFMLTLDELLAPTPAPDTLETARVRRAIHTEYKALDVPEIWDGTPSPFPVETDAARAEEVVSGAAVSPGAVEGVARLILDPDGDDDLEPGEILVCRTTDPSWASLMMVASALVIDIGGAISHGAIVARELGIPCVIGTRNGTAAIRTGDTLRVDGSAGTVEIVSRAE
jgi:pyruvate,water dikinase